MHRETNRSGKNGKRTIRKSSEKSTNSARRFSLHKTLPASTKRNNDMHQKRNRYFCVMCAKLFYTIIFINLYVRFTVKRNTIISRHSIRKMKDRSGKFEIDRERMHVFWWHGCAKMSHEIPPIAVCFCREQSRFALILGGGKKNCDQIKEKCWKPYRSIATSILPNLTIVIDKWVEQTHKQTNANGNTLIDSSKMEIAIIIYNYLLDGKW